ncbi:MAG: ABC transporter ATP-binding protein [Pseudomonadota bacterium]|nr:ABC transporter ATP-binding protein [Pseudomonadota bacterium]
MLRNVGGHYARGVFALRGPNGIGKSTLLGVLAGAVEADSGTVWIGEQSLHHAPVAAKARLAYAPDECPVYPFMSGREMLAFVAFAKRCALAPEVMEIVSRFGLDSHLDTRCGAMSLGTQKKLMLAAAWIGEPCVMLFDEPSNGLDAAARLILIDLLRARSTDNVILVSTHDHEFAQALGAITIEFESLNGSTSG